MLARAVIHPLAKIQASFGIGLRWYAFYTQARAEKKAEEAIRGLGFPVFVPFEKKIRRKPGRKSQPYEAPYFPRYGFVQFEINDDRWGGIVDADGVTDLVRTAGVPRTVPDSVIDALKLADSMGLLDRTQPFKTGIEVEVTEGPFSALIGKVMRARTGDRADVLFKGMFGGDCMMTMPLSFLREI